jgi:anti-sigma B factor antagonist
VEIGTRKSGDVEILDLSGSLTLGDPTESLRGRFKESLDAGQRLFILNVQQVEFMDSAGVAETVLCYKRAAEVGGVVKVVVAAASPIDDLFTLTALDRILELHRDEAEALGSFES